MNKLVSKHQTPEEQLAYLASIDFSQFVTKDYLDKVLDQKLDEKLEEKLEEKLDEKLKNYATKQDIYALIAYMPNKDDYVTRKEFDEFRMEFRGLQDLVLQIYDLVNTELVIRNRQFKAQFARHERALVRGGLLEGR